MCSFEHCSDLGNFWRLLEPSELISGHGQVGTLGLEDIMAVNMDELIIKVAVEWEWPPLRVELFSIVGNLD